MGVVRLKAAAVLLALMSTAMTATWAPGVVLVLAQPDGAAAMPGGYLTVQVGEGLLGGPEAMAAGAGWNVTVVAADGSWNQTCVTDAFGQCGFDLEGAKGTVTAANATRAFLLPRGSSDSWHVEPGTEDEGSPLGLGLGDAFPGMVVLLAALMGLVAAISLWRRRAPLLGLVGVGGFAVAGVLSLWWPIFAVTLFAGYAIVKDAKYFGAVPLDDADLDEEE